jgi:hypothetical protein
MAVGQVQEGSDRLMDLDGKGLPVKESSPRMEHALRSWLTLKNLLQSTSQSWQRIVH